MFRFAAAVRSLSPRSRRWSRFLRSLPLDPDRLPRPVEPPGPRDFIICGPSRSGTTLVTAALFQPGSTVTVMEPWDGMRLPPAALFASLRHEIEETGRLARGKLDIELLRTGEVRWCREGAAEVELDVGDAYLLGVKWPAYWRYLDLLPSTKFLVCLRHPAEIVASCRKSGGRLALGLDYDTAFNRRMNEELGAASEDPALRRVLLHEYVVSRILPHLERPNVFAVRFERWFTEPDLLLEELGAFLGVALGPGPARIRPPAPPTLTGEETRFLLERCRTADALGYSLAATG